MALPQNAINIYRSRMQGYMDSSRTASGPGDTLPTYHTKPDKHDSCTCQAWQVSKLG